MKKVSKFNHAYRSDPLARVARRRAMTLIELLVVMAIMLGLAAIAIPQLQPAMESRRMREAGRSVSVFFGSARTKALETGRPCGVTIEQVRNSNNVVVNNNAGIVLRQALVPLPYGGDSATAAGRIKITGQAGGTATFSAEIPIDSSIVKPGDIIQFNYQGPFYVIETVGNPSTLTLDVNNGQLLPWPSTSWSYMMPFKIYRRPVPSLAKIHKMPPMAAVDLAYSGTKSTLSRFANQAGPITIVFSPNGSIDTMYIGNGPPIPVTESIFLLVGRLDRIPAGGADMPNWKDPKCMWIKLSPKTGAITTAHCAVRGTVAGSREFADKCINTGG